MEGGGWEIDSEVQPESARDRIGRLLASDPNKDKHTLVKASVVMLSFTCGFSQNVKFRSIFVVAESSVFHVSLRKHFQCRYHPNIAHVHPDSPGPAGQS